MCRFDGDAMVHSVYFAGGKALSYQNHWLRTPKFLFERNFGAPLWAKVRHFNVHFYFRSSVSTSFYKSSTRESGQGSQTFESPYTQHSTLPMIRMARGPHQTFFFAGLNAGQHQHVETSHSNHQLVEPIATFSCCVLVNRQIVTAVQLYIDLELLARFCSDRHRRRLVLHAQ